MTLFNTSNNRFAKQLNKAGFDESKIKRDERGRFSSTGAVAAMGAGAAALGGAAGLLAAARGNPRMAMNMLRRPLRRAKTRVELGITSNAARQATELSSPLRSGLGYLLSGGAGSGLATSTAARRSMVRAARRGESPEQAIGNYVEAEARRKTRTAGRQVRRGIFDVFGV